MATATAHLDLLSTRQKLITAAERLFAAHGVNGVSLRQIGVEAGCGNTSAVQYHFGTKHELVQAILLYRLPRLNERRALLSAMASPNDLRAVLDAHLLPILEYSMIEDSHYLTFVEHVVCGSTGPEPFDTLPPEFREPRQAFIERVRALIPEVPQPIATRRALDVISTYLHAGAARERACRNGTPVMSLRSQAALLMDGAVGYVTAPVSDAAREALANEAASAVVPERVGD